MNIKTEWTSVDEVVPDSMRNVVVFDGTAWHGAYIERGNFISNKSGRVLEGITHWRDIELPAKACPLRKYLEWHGIENGIASESHDAIAELCRRELERNTR